LLLSKPVLKIKTTVTVVVKISTEKENLSNSIKDVFNLNSDNYIK